jgi:hypothetical protein
MECDGKIECSRCFPEDGIRREATVFYLSSPTGIWPNGLLDARCSKHPMEWMAFKKITHDEYLVRTVLNA